MKTRKQWEQYCRPNRDYFFRNDKAYKGCQVCHAKHGQRKKVFVGNVTFNLTNVVVHSKHRSPQIFGCDQCVTPIGNIESFEMPRRKSVLPQDIPSSPETFSPPKYKPDSCCVQCGQTVSRLPGCIRTYYCPQCER